MVTECGSFQRLLPCYQKIVFLFLFFGPMGVRDNMSCSSNVSAQLSRIIFKICFKNLFEIVFFIFTKKYQSTQRHGEAWQASLRYRKPDFDQMNGLRRVTLCQNKIADEGGRILADALRDDLWLKGRFPLYLLILLTRFFYKEPFWWG